MGKSEQFRYNPLEGERDQPQISVDAEALYDLLIRAETMVSKVDRIRYIHRAEDQILDVIAEYTLAYDFDDERGTHLRAMCGNIAKFIRTMRVIGKRNVICVSARYEGMTPDQVKRENARAPCQARRGCYKVEKIILKEIKGQGHDRQRRLKPAVSETIKEAPLPEEGS